MATERNWSFEECNISLRRLKYLLSKADRELGTFENSALGSLTHSQTLRIREIQLALGEAFDYLEKYYQDCKLDVLDGNG